VIVACVGAQSVGMSPGDVMNSNVSNQVLLIQMPMPTRFCCQVVLILLLLRNGDAGKGSGCKVIVACVGAQSVGMSPSVS